MPPLCRELRDRGVCSKGETCTYSHFLKLCELCRAILQNQATFNQHYTSRNHVERSFRNGGGAGGVCKTCNIPYGLRTESMEEFFEHCLSAAHLTLASDRPETVEKFALHVIPSWMHLCPTCQILIPKNQLIKHETSRRHVRINQYLESISLAHPELLVNVLIDFGVVDPLKQASTMAINLNLVESMDVTLVDIQMASAAEDLNFPRQNHFTPSSWRGRIRFPGDYGLPLEFQAKGLGGRFEDRIKLVFRASRNGVFRTFTIVRDVLAVVSIKDDLDKLRPTSPYQQPSSRFPREPKAVRGVKKPILSGVRFVVPLPQFPIPEDLQETMRSDQNFPQTLANLSGALLPSSPDVPPYTAHWSVLLHIEEFEMMNSLGEYDLQGQQLVTRGQFHILTVPGVPERRPSVAIGDRIYVRKVHEEPWYCGYVHNVEGKEVHLRFSNGFFNTNGQAYDVQFSLSRTPLRRMHQALHFSGDPTHILSPTQDHILDMRGDSRMAIDDIQLYNRQLHNNPPQKMAVASILCQAPGSVPFVVFGPPGTGKTVVVVEAMRQILDRNPEARLLACAPSNSAADLLADRLRQSGIMPSQLLRLNALTRPLANLSPTLLPYSKSNEGSFIIPDLHALKEYRVVISTCITASVLHAVGIPGDHYRYIFIDEAGQALEPEVMIPLRTLGGPHTNVVLAGDPKQLGPIVRSQYARKLGLHVSYLQRLIADPLYDISQGRGRIIVKLVQNFRSHPAILKFPSDRFYNGELEPCGNPIIINSLERWDRLVTPGFPIIFHAVNGEDHREEKSPSWFNPIEVTVVKQYVQALRENQKLRLTDNDIGVITPYHKQGRKILSAINTPELKRGRPGILKVGSVEDFQGQERRVIIVSCGRSNKNFIPRKLAEADPTAKGKRASMRACLGFVAEPARFNVAMTRAQALLICIGDPTVLSLDKMWRKFLDYIHARGGWKGIPKDWSAPEPGTEDSRDFVSLRQRDAQRVMDHLEVGGMEAALNGDNDASSSDSSSNSDLGEQPWREPE